MRQRANRKRFTAILLSLTMVLALCVTVSAEQVEEGSSVEPVVCETTDDASVPAEENTGKITSLDGLEIYPGAEEIQDGKKVWVAYDAEYSKTQPKDASIRATVTLPEDVTVPDGYQLFIRRISEGENYFATADAVQKRVSAYNAYQCYVIRWIKVNEEGNYEFVSMSEILGKDKDAAVKIDYLTSEARLAGPAGARKLLIFNSTQDGSLQDTIADQVTNVQVNEDAYESFVFRTKQAGPYVFVSKTLEKCYVEQLTIGKMVDGSEPFDSSDTPGNDSGADNRIVRSYDTIQYTLDANFAARENGVTKESITAYFELTLEKSATAARFDTSKMLWLGDNYTIEYLKEDGSVVMIQAHDGKFYEPKRDDQGNVIYDQNGFALVNEDKTVLLNAQLNGSMEGENSYKVPGGGITQQRLTGWKTLTANKGESILAGTKNFMAAVEVRNADNGEVFSPTFKLWLEGNEDNYGSESTNNNEMVPAQPVTDNVVKADGNYAVTVSAGTNFNLKLQKNTDMSYKNWFDFSTGDLVEEEIRAELVRLAGMEANHGKSNPAEFVDENGKELSADKKIEYANYRYGRITCYGITLQLYNDTDNDPAAYRASKGMKGLSLPVGDITFDLNFSSEVTANGKSFEGSDTEYTAILWDYNENVPANTSYKKTYVDPGRGMVATPNDGKGNGGRNLYWDYEPRSPYAKGAAPSNYMAYHGGCYYGGDWALMNGKNKVTGLSELNAIASPSVVKGTGGNNTYHFSVSDYDFDFDGRHFPVSDAGNSGNVTGYDTYAKCFSAGCVQVLSVFPMVQKESVAEIQLNATVSNLYLVTRAGQELKAADNDKTKIQHEVNKDDNARTDQIVVYAPGNLTKGSAFNGKYGTNHDQTPTMVNQGYLGTEYWTTSYDCSTFAGDDIWLISYGMMASGSDYRTHSMNLLQLFDSRALSIRGDAEVNQEIGQGNDGGTVNYLYAADPDYPEGYDTNALTRDGKETMLSYMNIVREEDLVYSRNRPDAEGNITVNGKSMKCIGVLMEIRSCNLLGGKYQYLRIPVRVNGNDENLVGKTVATVNAFRVWSYDLKNAEGKALTWADGQWDEKTGKNKLEGYVAPSKEHSSADSYSGELANVPGKLTYVKTEYQNGLQVKGTHGGGTLAGNSLLILGYKAHISIGVDNKSSAESISYDQGAGETVVDYRLKNIKTEISDLTGQGNMPKTTLTVRAVLDIKHTGSQRISVSGGTYHMQGYEVGEDGRPIGEVKDIAIGTDSNSPTRLAFKDSDGKVHVINVYAVLGTNNQEVSFMISDVPVGIRIPDITFQANFGAVTALKENDTIETATYISGAGDNRAYDKAKGNEDHITVGVVLGGGTNLTKAVDVKYIDLNREITYNVTYTNSGHSTISTMYFYDLLPNPTDVRGSNFTGDVILRDFDVTSSGADVGIAPAEATVYYSTTEYWELYDRVKVFGGYMKDGKVTDMDESKVEEMLKSGKNSENEPLLMVLGKVTDGTFEYDSSFGNMSKQEITKLMSDVTGLYVKAENLHGTQTIDLEFTVEANGNKAGDLYKNISSSWNPGSANLPLTSNMVETAAVSRCISGVVWYDWNLNGIRDEDVDGEKPLKGVTATLFQKNASGQYEECKADITGAAITPVTTDENGAYSFGNLAAGDYIVAFSGKNLSGTDVLKPYTGATIYQQNGVNDSNTNDGVAISELKASGIDKDQYAYFIRYSAEPGRPGESESEKMTLHSIEDIRKGVVSLNNYTEEFSHQDLGLVTSEYELPETGGMGTGLYRTGGLLLMTAALPVWGWSRRRRKRGSLFCMERKRRR